MARATKTAKTPPAYPAWKAEASQELQRRHEIAATSIPERTWTNLYIRRLAPKDAAERAATEYNNSHRPKWVKKR
jgi:hypothetical protein